jgi:Flp pilus assembly secretin CpaC
MIAFADDVIVLKGSSAQIPVPDGIKKIIVANPAVIDARPSDDGLSVLVNGLGLGNSELRIQKLQGADLVDNVVVQNNLDQTLSEVKDLLSDVEGLEIKTLGNKILFKGNLLTKSDYDKVNRVIAAYPSAILNMSTFNRSEMNKYVEEAILKDIGLDTVTARVMEDTVVLEGVVYSEADKARAEEMAKLRMPSVKNLLTVQDVMIETDVQFITLDLTKGKNMGMNVLDTLSLNAGGSGSSVSGGFNNLPISFGVSGNARFVADLLNSNGKTVDSPHLSTKNGETGSFQSGGTAYLNAPGAQGVGNLIQVDYGVILKVKPTLEGRDRVKNEVTIEVSTPTTTSGSQFTLLKYNTTCTSVCKVGESMIISGMTQTISAGNSSKTPLLGDVPLLELFFSNKTADKERHEFVIVVTPRPVFPMAATGPAFSEQHNELLQDKDKDKPLKN